MTEEKIQRINELAHRSMTPAGLTEAENAEQTELRNEFRRRVVSSLTSQLDCCTIVDEKGNVLKKAKNAK